MERIFKCLDTDFFRVPDGTLVNPFLNPKDIMSDLPWELLDQLSISAGVIKPGVTSEIHVHPYISQVTLLISGKITIHMKDPGIPNPPYQLDLALPEASGGEGYSSVAVLASPGTFFQLDNSNGEEPAKVLYLTSPSYVFEPGLTTDSPPIYDDAITLGRDWKRLADQSWNPPEMNDPERSFSARQGAIQRLAAQSREKTSRSNQ